MPAAKKLQMNEHQAKAVLHESGPLLVVAGAGTGKTRVITERIKNLIEKKGVNPTEILALTFTEKAAREMVERVGDVMPLGYEEPWMYTFHSFSDRILRAEGLEIGLDTSYKIMSYPEQWLMIRRNLFDFDLKYYRPLGNPTKFISAILKFISRLQDENITPEDLSEFVRKIPSEDEEKERWQELSHIYEKYQELKMQHSKLDFGDLITMTLRLFTERPAILSKYRGQFRHVLVDEFQDTNYAQYELIKLLAGESTLKDRSLIVVGDDSQSIYKFRGAAVSNILEFRKDYPSSEMITLLQNYRSIQSILDASYKLVKNNNPDTLEVKLNISKELVSQLDPSPLKPVIYETATLEEEVETVISKIVQILATEPQYTYKDFAILARANNHLDAFVLALRKHQLPYQLVGNRGLYDREEVRDILALMKVLVNPLDAISLYRVLNIETLEIPQEEISKLLSTARYQKTDLWEIVKQSKEEKIVSLFNVISEFQSRITKNTPVQIVYDLVNSINYLAPYISEENIENQMIIKNLDLFLNKVKTFEVEFRSENKELPTVLDFVDYLELMIEAGENPAQAEVEDIETINLMTVHSSKGLEFPVVFMVNLVANRFPTRNRSDEIEVPEELIKETLPSGNAHIQEERRLFYVGMTRAQKYLFMIYGKSYGGKRENTPSGFLGETGLKTEKIDQDISRKENSQTGLFGTNTQYRAPSLQKITGFVPSFLSYTQISSYKTCPLKYKFAYVLNIPTPPNHALSFGSTIHDTLRDFHSKMAFDPNASLDELLRIYTRNWQPLGYLNGQHREEYFENGKRLLQDYYSKNWPPRIKPLHIEKSFNLWIDGIKFYGRIDRIDPLDDGSVEIIDYKTGGTKSQKEVDSDDQVAFYALGTKQALKLNPSKLTMYYVESGQRITTTRTEKELEEKKEEVKEAVQKIKAGDFPSQPGMHCTWCDYKDICPFAFKN
jgi:DNA helicase II / ATP-dependent DNA helicase PcrA